MARSFADIKSVEMEFVPRVGLTIDIATETGDDVDLVVQDGWAPRHARRARPPIERWLQAAGFRPQTQPSWPHRIVHARRWEDVDWLP